MLKNDRNAGVESCVSRSCVHLDQKWKEADDELIERRHQHVLLPTSCHCLVMSEIKLFRELSEHDSRESTVFVDVQL